jgi:hypothetical protein
MPPGWNVLNDTVYTDGQGHVYVLGEIYNNTGSNQEIWVIVDFFDEQNNRVAQEVAASVVEVVPQGSKVPFSLEAELRLPYARYEILVDGDSSDLQPRQDLQVLNHTGEAGQVYRITGELSNPGEALVTYAEVVATLYDGAGRVVNVGYGFLPAGELGAGQTASFEVLIQQPHESIASYALVVFGF